MVDWRFRRRQGSCGACETAFAEGERHVSALVVQGEELIRRDVCLACWDASASRSDLFHWFTRHQQDRAALKLDLGTLEELFVRLEGRTETKIAQLRYVLCLLLMRKRRVKLDKLERGAGDEAMRVHRPRRKESFRVQVFDFDVARLNELRGELRQLFDGTDFAAGEPGAEPASAAAEDLARAPTDAAARDAEPIAPDRTAGN